MEEPHNLLLDILPDWFERTLWIRNLALRVTQLTNIYIIKSSMTYACIALTVAHYIKY